MKKSIFCLVLPFLLFSCPDDDMSLALQDVTHEVIFFEYTPDTGNMTSRLQYEIIFTNSNDLAVNGFARITINVDGLESTTLGSSNSQCYLIPANSNCTYSFFGEDSHDLGVANSIQLVGVEYDVLEE